METRKLTTEEINRLIQQGCVAANWQNINVVPGFKTDHIHNVRFSGEIQLGTFNGTFQLQGGLTLHAGLNRVTRGEKQLSIASVHGKHELNNKPQMTDAGFELTLCQVVSQSSTTS